MAVALIAAATEALKKWDAGCLTSRVKLDFQS